MTIESNYISLLTTVFADLNNSSENKPSESFHNSLEAYNSTVKALELALSARDQDAEFTKPKISELDGELKSKQHELQENQQKISSLDKELQDTKDLHAKAAKYFNKQTTEINGVEVELDLTKPETQTIKEINNVYSQEQSLTASIDELVKLAEEQKELAAKAKAAVIELVSTNLSKHRHLKEAEFYAEFYEPGSNYGSHNGHRDGTDVRSHVDGNNVNEIHNDHVNNADIDTHTHTPTHTNTNAGANDDDINVNQMEIDQEDGESDGGYTPAGIDDEFREADYDL